MKRNFVILLFFKFVFIYFPIFLFFIKIYFYGYVRKQNGNMSLNVQECGFTGCVKPV